MNKSIKNIIVVLVILVLGGGVYMYFSGSGVPLNASSLASSNGTINTASAGVISSQIETDVSFLSTLLGLNSIKIDPTLFTSASFSALEDNTVKIEGGGDVGRSNPFAPIEEPVVVPSTENSLEPVQVITLPTVNKPANKPTKK